MSVATLHAWTCDGVCRKQVLVAAPGDASKHPPGWRLVDGATWCGSQECRDAVVAKYRAGVSQSATQRADEFQAVAEREEQVS